MNSQLIKHRFLPLGIFLCVAGAVGALFLDTLSVLKWCGLLTSLAMLAYVILIERQLSLCGDAGPAVIANDSSEELLRIAHSEFLSTISHEIRTPMHAIIGMTDLLRATPLDAQQEGFTKAIDDASHTLMAMIDDMLDFSKMGAGDLALEWRAGNLLAIVEASVELVASRARSKGLRLASYIDPELPEQLRCDPDRLRQILLHLLENAIKFTESGVVTVSVRIAERHVEHYLVRFEVRDTGIGIDSDAQTRIFKPFSQGDGSARRKYGGTGLGLSICRQLIELMGGAIGVGSRQQIGSVFWFELPLSLLMPPKVTNDAAVPHEPPMRSAEPPLSGELILVAPVNDAVRCLSDYVQDFGLNVRRATTLASGLEMLNGHLSNTILVVDTAVPDFSSQILRNAYFQNQFSSCVVVVANDDEREDLSMPSVLPVLVQPITQSALRSALLATISAQSKSTETAVSVAPSSASSQRSPSQGALVLLVEDNLLNQKVAVHQLHQIGYAVDVVMNGQEALCALESNHYAAILMDCQMPVMDGFETTRQIRLKEQTRDAHIPIIAMTANAMVGDRELCLAAGMDDYLSKPIQRNQLDVVLAHYTTKTQGMDAVTSQFSPPSILEDVLDMKRLSDLFEDDEQSMIAMLDLFILHTEPMLQELQQTVLLQDMEQIGMQLHRLFGACSNLGAGQMTSLVKQASTAVSENQIVSLQRLCQDLFVAFIRLREQTKNIRGQHECLDRR